ncbi:hypothetical protein [Marinoscillum furvescens]|uniref:DUF4369 domain-containing protein n=1 Tax=Marinoscillum furvescens DSM 4134 TaxID=1122208 RepID=A0A3D9KW07_MARFU|nr:hypothetical protein [Marinoscillum furvescens]RED91744.1 hypothetical protein C7460_13714 [Marinoscillum furvescens DSM 4134]
MKQIAIAFLLILTAFTTLAQGDYAVLASTDTLYGKVTLLMPENTTERITLTTEEQEYTFAANQLLEVKKDDDYYKGVRFGDKYRLMKRLTKGYLTLFEYRYDDSFHFGAQYLLKANGDGMEVPNIAFRSNMSKFLETECPGFAQKVANKAYKRSEVVQLVKDFNNSCTDRQPTPLDPAKSNDSLYDLATLLVDIQKRQASGEKIPAYMIQALESYADQDVNKALKGLIDNLKTSR